MATPPDMSDTFVKEVDENLRRDRLRDFARNNASLMIGGVILFLALCGGLIFWHSHNIKTAEGQVEQLAQTYASLDTGNSAAAPQQLADLSDSGNKGVRGSALFGQAAVDLQHGNTKSAIVKYHAIQADSSLPAPFRDLALIRATTLEFDSLPPEQVVARLKPLTVSGNPWFGSAGELTASALLKEGKKDEAGKLFAALARDKTVPDTIRSRAIQIASTLGIDASDALPAAPAQ